MKTYLKIMEGTTGRGDRYRGPRDAGKPHRPQFPEASLENREVALDRRY